MAAAIAMELHGDLLRGLCDALGVHCQGLSQAARRARAGGLLDNGLCNKLVAVDTCFGLLRHVTKVSADRLRGDVFAAIVPAAQTHLHQPDVVMDESVCELRAEAPEFVPAVIFEAPPWDKPTTSTASGGGHRADARAAPTPLSSSSASCSLTTCGSPGDDVRAPPTFQSATCSVVAELDHAVDRGGIAEAFANAELGTTLNMLRDICEMASKQMRGNIHPLVREVYRSEAAPEVIDATIDSLMERYRSSFIEYIGDALTFHRAFPDGIPEEVKDVIELSISRDVCFFKSDKSTGAKSPGAGLSPEQSGGALISQPTPTDAVAGALKRNPGFGKGPKRTKKRR